jgi:hypothetical protein
LVTPKSENQLEINFEAIPKNKPELAETWTWRFLKKVQTVGSKNLTQLGFLFLKMFFRIETK